MEPPRPCLYARFTTAPFRDFYHRSQDAFFGQISLSPFKAKEVKDEGTSKPQPRSDGRCIKRYDITRGNAVMVVVVVRGNRRKARRTTPNSLTALTGFLKFGKLVS